MIRMSLSQAATLLDCSPLISDIAFTGITTDSRQIVPGMLFAALAGQTFDGHDYIQQAMDLGAVAALVDRDVSTDLPVLKVDDVLVVRVMLSCSLRISCPSTVFCMIGCYGKSTVKDMLASILSQD